MLILWFIREKIDEDKMLAILIELIRNLFDIIQSEQVPLQFYKLKKSFTKTKINQSTLHQLKRWSRESGSSTWSMTKHCQNGNKKIFLTQRCIFSTSPVKSLHPHISFLSNKVSHRKGFLFISEFNKGAIHHLWPNFIVTDHYQTLTS